MSLSYRFRPARIWVKRALIQIRWLFTPKCKACKGNGLQVTVKKHSIEQERCPVCKGHGDRKAH